MTVSVYYWNINNHVWCPAAPTEHNSEEIQKKKKSDVLFQLTWPIVAKLSL